MKAIICDHCGTIDSSPETQRQLESDNDILCPQCHLAWCKAIDNLDCEYLARKNKVNEVFGIPKYPNPSIFRVSGTP